MGWVDEAFSVLIRGFRVCSVGFALVTGWLAMVWHGFLGVVLGRVLGSEQRFLAASMQVLSDRRLATLTSDRRDPTTYLHTCSHVEVISCLRSIC